MSAASRVCEHCRERIDAQAEACRACGHLYERVPCPDRPDQAAPGQCVLCGVPVCGDLPEGGRPYRCAAHADVPVIEGWAQVYSTSTDLDAELVRDNLQAEGLDSRILSQKDHFFAPVTFGDLSPVRVLVPAFAYLDATAILRTHTASSGDVRFACAACGEPYEPDAEVCASCGAALR